MMRSLIASLLVVCLGLCHGAPASNLITDLPGLKTKPSFKQYSGYLSGSDTKKLHYWFVESENNPKTDPVVLWLNGGPGCSSDLGMLTEHGPFRIQPDGATLTNNPFSWNTVANMLYLEAPAGVGYSYATDGETAVNDDETAKYNHQALKDFFTKFPEYQKNEFFITGESYGGIYVPTLSSLVVDDPSFNFKGFAVGNGLSNDELNDDSIVYFAYYHGLIGETMWNNLITTCCKGNETNCTFSKTAQTSPTCASYVNEVVGLVWGGDLNVYNLYGPCVPPSSPSHSFLGSKVADGHLVTANFGWNFASFPRMKAERLWLKRMQKRYGGKLTTTPPCIDASGAIKYMNSAAVKQALHVKMDLPEWGPCSNIDYTKQYSDMSPQYQKVLKKGKRVLVYNGDIDMACNFLGDEWFVDRLGVPVVNARKEWMYKDAMHTPQVAGFVKEFKDLTFVTVRGAGHMVPTDRPRPALEMFINFITNKPFSVKSPQ